MIARSALVSLLCLLLAWTCLVPAEASFLTLKKSLAAAKALAPSSDSKKEDSSDDDDDDDEDDDEADDAKTEEKVEQKLSPHASEETRLTKQLKAAKQDLAGNVRKQADLESTIKHLSDDSESDKEIDSSSKLVANETDSPAMGSMLGKMWKDMRMFETPFFAEHVAEEIHHLKRDRKGLVAKVALAKKKLSTAQKRWAEKAKETTEKKSAKVEDDTSDIEDAKTKDSKKKVKAEETEKEKASTLEEKAEDDGEQKKDAAAKDVSPIKHVGGATQTSMPAQTWSFWSMKWPQQKNALISSLVYLVFGILIAFLYKRMRVTHAGIFTPVPRPDIYASPKDFSFSLFGCFGDPKTCVMGCFCPSLRWADTLDKRRLMACWRDFLAMFGLFLLHIYTYGISSLLVTILGVVYRQKLRKGYQIEYGTGATVAMDLLTWCCCLPCAVIQEAREESVQRIDV